MHFIIDKSHGSNSITVEFLRYGGMTLIKEMTKLINEVWVNDMPRVWKSPEKEQYAQYTKTETR